MIDHVIAFLLLLAGYVFWCSYRRFSDGEGLFYVFICAVTAAIIEAVWWANWFAQ